MNSPSEVSPDRVHPDRAGWTRAAKVIPALLLLAYLAQCAWFIGTQSLTIDEPMDLMAGLEQWRLGQYSGGIAWNDHPPFARQLCTLPAMNPKFQIINAPPNVPQTYPTGTRKIVLPDPESLAWHTRPMDALLGAILGVLLWLAARSLYSIGAANFVLALFAFSPSLIAHFSIGGKNDGAITLMAFATAFQLYRWRRNPSRWETVLLGLVLGGLLVSKASALPLFAIAIAMMLVFTPRGVTLNFKQFNWKKATAAVAISFLVVWGMYRFHVSTVRLAVNGHRVSLVSITIPNRPDPMLYDSAAKANLSLPVPAFEYLQGLVFQLKHEKDGHAAFLLGRSYVGGSLAYFPVAIALKWPIVVLIVALSSVVLLILRRVPRPDNLVWWAVFPVVYFALAEFGRMNIGERHILPVYPFVLLLCGSVWALTRGHRTIWLLLLLAPVLNAADTLRYAPDYLSYFTPIVRPANTFELLSDSNVDWGSGLIALRNYEREHPNEQIHLAYSGTVDPALYGVKGIPLMPNEPASGTVVVSANYLSGQTLPDGPDGYRWLLQYPRKAILDHSLYVFEVPPGAGSSSLNVRH